MRITKEIAGKVAGKLVAKLTERLKEIEIEFGQILCSEWSKRTPKEILTVFVTAPSFVRTKSTGYIYFSGRYVFCSHDKKFPMSDDNLKVEDIELCNYLSALENEKIELQKKKRHSIRSSLKLF